MLLTLALFALGVVPFDLLGSLFFFFFFFFSTDYYYYYSMFNYAFSVCVLPMFVFV